MSAATAAAISVHWANLRAVLEEAPLPAAFRDHVERHVRDMQDCVDTVTSHLLRPAHVPGEACTCAPGPSGEWQTAAHCPQHGAGV